MSDEKKARERGPNYDWAHEVKHYKDECTELRELLRKVESSAERDVYELEQKLAEAEKECDSWQERARINGECGFKYQDERDELQAKLAEAEQFAIRETQRKIVAWSERDALQAKLTRAEEMLTRMAEALKKCRHFGIELCEDTKVSTHQFSLEQAKITLAEYEKWKQGDGE